MDDYHRNYYLNHLKKYRSEDYINAFLSITKDGGKYLTKKGFDEQSPISSVSIIKGLNICWKDLLERYDKLEELFDYAVVEYKKHAYKNGKANSTKFTKEHPYLKQYTFSNVIDIKKVRQAGGFINNSYNGQYNEYLLKRHFKKVKEIIGDIPSVSQFIKYGKILPSIYCDYFGVEGQRWEEVLEIIIEDKNELERHLISRDLLYKKIAIENLRKYQIENTISYTVLETEYKKVFDFFYTNYGTHPTRRLFNEHSVFSDMTYRKKLKLRWSEVASYYGYTLQERNVTEKVFLEIFKKVIECDYKRNESWSWLIGVKGKRLYCDGYFKELNLVVEFDGKQHRTPVPNFGGRERFIRDQQNDAIKEKLVKENGYKFMRISSKERWKDVEYLKKRLNELGIYL
ncbi:hypothetical protein [Sporosarcina sp. FA9]|uniref:hypothetical protein n=1 Tax=Sporosarcina sp. FA9 TaxID=3413030 RepID=UPI003F65B603